MTLVTMRSRSPRDVFTLDELARAAGVPRGVLEELVREGRLTPIPDTPYFTEADAVRAARQLRADTSWAGAPAPAAELFAGFAPERASAAPGHMRGRTIVSGSVHVSLLAVLLVLTGGSPEPTVAAQISEPTRLVFLVAPGPGGGGGGGGARDRRPATPLQRRGANRLNLSVPKATLDLAPTTPRETPAPPRPAAPPAEPVKPQPPPEILPAKVIVAPVLETAANERDRAGAIEQPRGDVAVSQGPGSAGGAGTGRGTGTGEGLGAGIGEGTGGGTGGGPYRPGSGIEPPRLLREVKAAYTEDARRRGISGEVLLEIVVLRDGSVGDVRVLRGLGGGLEERAIAAVRQWRFSPARRRGEAVDVVVEVAVEFTLR